MSSFLAKEVENRIFWILMCQQVIDVGRYCRFPNTWKTIYPESAGWTVSSLIAESPVFEFLKL